MKKFRYYYITFYTLLIKTAYNSLLLLNKAKKLQFESNLVTYENVLYEYIKKGKSNRFFARIIPTINQSWMREDLKVLFTNLHDMV